MEKNGGEDSERQGGICQTLYCKPRIYAFNVLASYFLW